MAANLTPEHYATFRTIEQALLAATWAKVVGADDALRELELLKRELESKPKTHWVDALIATENGGRID